MNLHFEPSVPVKRSQLRQRRVAVVVSITLTAGLLAGLGSLMDQVKLREVPIYQPLFVMRAAEMDTTCGGCSGIPVKWPVNKKPTPPSSMVSPLGLASHEDFTKPQSPMNEWD